VGKGQMREKLAEALDGLFELFARIRLSLI
jgi:hypothetical protein